MLEHMKRVLAGLLVAFGVVAIAIPSTVGALASDPKLFISGDNTFYAYAKAGETVSASFLRVNQDEPFDTPREDVTITLDGPGVEQQRCVASKNVAVGQGCRFAEQTAQKAGIWRIQFAVPPTAKAYNEVSPAVRWAKNLFSWDISIKSGQTEQKGRIWTERYAIRQPAPASFTTDLNYHYISEDGYIYRATYKGYHGQISTLSADAVGIRSGTGCVSAYQSTEVSNTKFTPALGSCGNAYKLFFEEPAGNLPATAKTWEDKDEWVRPNISRPSISELNFASDNSTDQQSGTITFFLRNFIGQYQIKVDVNNDGSFNGQDDVVINQQIKRLTNGLQSIRFDGTDKTGQIISPSQPIGVRVEITKVAEIHLVAADVEGRTGGLELVRISGDNAPTTGLCWNDTELGEMPENLAIPILDGRACPDSTKGVHGWAYADSSWGNARYVDDWVYASATLEGNNQIVYPQSAAVNEEAESSRVQLAVIIGVGTGLIAVVAVAIVVIKRRNKRPPQLPPPPPAPGDPTITSL